MTKQEIVGPEQHIISKLQAKMLSIPGQRRVPESSILYGKIAEFWNPQNHHEDNPKPSAKSENGHVDSAVYRIGHRKLYGGVSQLLAEQENTTRSRSLSIERWLRTERLLNTDQRNMIISWLGKGKVLTIEEALERIGRRIEKDSQQGKRRAR